MNCTRSACVLLIALLLLGVTGCAGANTVADELGPLVDKTRRAAEFGQHDQARLHLNALRTRAQSLLGSGQLSQGEYQEIMTAAHDVENHLSASLEFPAAPALPVEPQAPTATEDTDEKEQEEDEEEGKEEDEEDEENKGRDPPGKAKGKNKDD